MSENDQDRSDSGTTVSELKTMIREFVDEREWRQFHSPKNLAMALAIEAAELMEHFQWITPEASRELDDEAKFAVGEELADVLCYGFAIANELGLDVATAMNQKMVKNRIKYPVAQIKGRYGHDDPNPVTDS